MENKTLTIGWLYPDLMSTYGDRGNVIVLAKRAQWRGIAAEVKHISVDTPASEIGTCDLLFMGGAQDTQQEIVNRDLEQQKGAYLKKAVEQGIPALFICGAFQFMGKYYKAADGTMMNGLSIFDLYTENPGVNHPRLIGNIVIAPTIPGFNANVQFVGFENHGGRTYIGSSHNALGKVVRGFGNNDTDKSEGIVYKNAIGTYLHGPILPKNPELADYLLKQALRVKYGEEVILAEFDVVLERRAREGVVGK